MCFEGGGSRHPCIGTAVLTGIHACVPRVMATEIRRRPAPPLPPFLSGDGAGGGGARSGAVPADHPPGILGGAAGVAVLGLPLHAPEGLRAGGLPTLWLEAG
jgi:hypothetical protein